MPSLNSVVLNPDVVQAIQEAKHDGALKSRFLVDAIPTSGREYDRDEINADDENEDNAVTNQYDVATPLPDLFSDEKTR